MPDYKLECAVWELTLNCNLRCIHCGSSAGAKREAELNSEEAIKLCEQLKETGCLSVALMGGEPFLRKDFWDIALKIRELNMELSVITNGTLFDKDTFSRLKALSPRAVAVSIDGADSETHEFIRGVKGCYKKSWEFIEKALKEDLPLSVITTISKLNISNLPELSKQIAKRNIAWQIQTAGAEGARFPKEYLLDMEEFYSVGVFIENLRRKYSVEEMPVIGAHDLGYNSCYLKNVSLESKWNGCQAGISVIGIRSNGDILGCLSINDKRFVEGNIKERNLKEIWNNPGSFSYNRNFKMEDAGENCAGCGYLSSCRGGCSEMSWMKTGKLHNDLYCFYRIEEELMKEENIFAKFFYKLSKIKRSVKNKSDFSILKKIFLGERK